MAIDEEERGDLARSFRDIEAFEAFVEVAGHRKVYGSDVEAQRVVQDVEIYVLRHCWKLVRCFQDRVLFEAHTAAGCCDARIDVGGLPVPVLARVEPQSKDR